MSTTELRLCVNSQPVTSSFHQQQRRDHSVTGQQKPIIKQLLKLSLKSDDALMTIIRTRINAQKQNDRYCVNSLQRVACTGVAGRTCRHWLYAPHAAHTHWLCSSKKGLLKLFSCYLSSSRTSEPNSLETLQTSLRYAASFHSAHMQPHLCHLHWIFSDKFSNTQSFLQLSDWQKNACIKKSPALK